MFSIIIPCRTVGEAERCVNECLKLDYDMFEIIVLPDVYDCELQVSGKVGKHIFIRIEPTGDMLPSAKRDCGIEMANGDILAFIDADAYPDRNWLANAQYYLDEEEELAGVCGAGIMPPDSNWRKSVADRVLQVLPFNYRVTGQHERFVNDYPTFNLIIRRADVQAAGGFDCEYLTGEDTLLCHKIVNVLGKKILYTPVTIVYHDRREVFVPFLKQIWTYGIHRGYFFKRHPHTSRKLVYALPSIGLICCILLLLYLLLH